jgi:hypothetical protein
MLPIIFRGHDEAGFFAFGVGLGPGPSPLSVLPGNRRTVEARYACLIVVKDYVRMSAQSRDAGVWHYSALEPEILGDVRAGRAVLVFDLSNEGPPYDPGIFGILYDWIERNSLPAGRCIWLSQNRLTAGAAEAHVGGRAGLIQFGHYDYFIKRIAWKFSPAGAREIIGADTSRYLEVLLDATRKDKLLLCMNATPRLARVLAVAALHHHQLLDLSLVSFAGMNYVKRGASLPEIFRFLDAHLSLEYLRPWVHRVANISSALRVDDFHEQGNELVEKIDRRVYERTFFSLITESDFTEPGIVRVTEKTVKAFCMGHPTVIIGNTHSVDIMKDLGFKDWCGVFDRSAESIASPAARFESVFTEVLRQSRGIDRDPQAWLDAVRDVSLHNHWYAASGAFLAHYAETFDAPLLARLTSLIAA